MYNVVIVDDEPIALKCLAMTLEQIKLPLSVVCETDNAADALKFLRDNPVDIVITDIKMPKMSGITLAMRIKEKFPLVRVLMLSGYSDFKFAQESIRYSVVDYLLKPVKAGDLKQSLLRIIDGLKKRGGISQAAHEQISKMVLSVIISDDERQTETIVGYWNAVCADLSESERGEAASAVFVSVQQLYYRQFSAIAHGNLFLPPFENGDMEKWLENLKGLSAELRKQEAPSVLNQMKEYLDENYSADITLEDLAKHFGYNSNYVSQLFKSAAGTSFTKYRNEIRVEKAKYILVSTGRSISDIATSVGYSDIAYFIRVFKRETKETPRDYRKARSLGTKQF